MGIVNNKLGNLPKAEIGFHPQTHVLNHYASCLFSFNLYVNMRSVILLLR